MRKKPTYEDLEQRIKALEKSDIKARQAQDALYEIEENFRTIADSTPVAVMLYQDDRWIYVNRAAEIITGYSAKEPVSYTHLRRRRCHIVSYGTRSAA